MEMKKIILFTVVLLTGINAKNVNQLVQSCINGDNKACVIAGYSYESGTGVRRNPFKAVKLYKFEYRFLFYCLY